MRGPSPPPGRRAGTGADRTRGAGRGSGRAPRRRPPADRAVGRSRSLALAGLGWLGYHYWTVGRFMVSTDDAYVQADFTIVAPKIPGYVASVPAVENHPVKAGDPLVDARGRRLSRRADARRGAARRPGRRRSARIDSQAAAGGRRHRPGRGAGRGGEGGGRGDRGRPRALPAAREQRRRERAAARERPGGGRRGAGGGARGRGRGRDGAGEPGGDHGAEGRGAGDDRGAHGLARQGAARPRRDGAAGTVRRHGRQPLGRGGRPRRAGQAAARGGAARARSTSRRTSRRRRSPSSHPGTRCTLDFDAFPGRELTGTVQGVAPASGSQFSLLPPENATGNFTKIVQRVPVRIAVPGGRGGRGLAPARASRSRCRPTSGRPARQPETEAPRHGAAAAAGAGGHRPEADRLLRAGLRHVHGDPRHPDRLVVARRRSRPGCRPRPRRSPGCRRAT